MGFFKENNNYDESCRDDTYDIHVCVCVCVLCVCIFIYTHMDCAYVTLPLGYYFSSWDKVL